MSQLLRNVLGDRMTVVIEEHGFDPVCMLSDDGPFLVSQVSHEVLRWSAHNELWEPHCNYAEILTNLTIREFIASSNHKSLGKHFKRGKISSKACQSISIRGS